jgi:hypothetical protein
MPGLPGQLTYILAVNPLRRPDVFILIHLQQLLTPWPIVKKYDILTEDVLLRVVNFP